MIDRVLITHRFFHDIAIRVKSAVDINFLFDIYLHGLLTDEVLRYAGDKSVCKPHIGFGTVCDANGQPSQIQLFTNIVHSHNVI